MKNWKKGENRIFINFFSVHNTNHNRNHNILQYKSQQFYRPTYSKNKQTMRFEVDPKITYTSNLKLKLIHETRNWRFPTQIT